MLEPITETLQREREHLDRFWPDRVQSEMVWTAGPALEKLPDLRVRVVSPSTRRDPWAYVTVGAWTAYPQANHGLEFVLLSQDEDPRHVELLSMVANLHADSRYRLTLGAGVPIGRPWAEGAAADHLLVALPYPFGPVLENCIGGGRHIRFLWLVPITSAEASFMRRDGVDALEQRFEDRGLDMIAPDRASAV